MLSPKSLILNVRLSPEAKNPPKGAINDAKVAKMNTWNWTGMVVNVVGIGRPGGMKGMVYLRGMKTGFGVHSKPV